MGGGGYRFANFLGGGESAIFCSKAGQKGDYFTRKNFSANFFPRYCNFFKILGFFFLQKGPGDFFFKLRGFKKKKPNIKSALGFFGERKNLVVSFRFKTFF